MRTAHKILGSCILLLAATACSDSPPTEPGTSSAAAGAAATPIVVVDLSNGSGVSGGDAHTISSTGIILGRAGAQRLWWQSPSPVQHVLDGDFVLGGNRHADAGGSTATVLLSTNGGAPWTSLTLQLPPGGAALKTQIRDLNDARAAVGTSGSSEPYAYYWANPAAAPVRLSLPASPYPVIGSTARSISGTGLIAGSASVQLDRKSTRSEAVLWTDGTARLLPMAPGAVSQAASNVNDAGAVSGSMDDSRGGHYAVRWTPDGAGGYAVAVLTSVSGVFPETGIDACGRISGGSPRGAFLWTGATALILPGLGAAGLQGFAYDISESGEAVGYSTLGTSKGSPVSHPALWTGLGSCTP